MRRPPCRVKAVCYVFVTSLKEVGLSQGAPSSWTVGSLVEAIRARGVDDEISVARVEGAEPVIVATMHSHGDLTIYVSIAGEQIVVSTLLWPLDEQEDVDEFNAFLLKAQKVVPLSNFAITDLGGREYYELIGELSSESSLDMILLELRVLADNAISAARDLREAFAA